MVEIAQGIFPPGVVQAIGGDDALGPMLTAHPGIAKISFTGSIPTGKKIMAACANTLKRVTLELGGNDASIVLPDVDIKAVAPQLVMGAFQNSGQVCVATKRIYIHKDIYQETLAAMVEFTKSMTVGAPTDGAHLGPIQNQMQYEKVKTFFEDTKVSNAMTIRNDLTLTFSTEQGLQVRCRRARRCFQQGLLYPANDHRQPSK